MKIFKPNFWNKKKSLIAITLLPVSAFLQVFISIKNQFIRAKHKTQSKKYNQETIDALRVLGLKAGVSVSEIKTAYRSLAKEFHPDKLFGMSEGIINLAKEKFQLIQNSYEYLNKHYV